MPAGYLAQSPGQVGLSLVQGEVFFGEQSLPRCLGLLVLLDLLLLLVPGPILGPDLFVLRDRGWGVLDGPDPLSKRINRESGERKKRRARNRDKGYFLTREI